MVELSPITSVPLNTLEEMVDYVDYYHNGVVIKNKTLSAEI